MSQGSPHTFGTIDIGSNGVRFFIGRVFRGKAHAVIDHREPIRLGKDSFSQGRISQPMVEQLVQSFLTFRRHAQNHGVLHWRAVATSALRDARNRQHVVHEIWRRTGVTIEVIDGLTEARLLHLAVQKVLPLKRQSALLFDMGGGSLEVVSTQGQNIKHAMSLRLGTVRLIERCGVDAPYTHYRHLIRRELERLVESCDPIPHLIQPEFLVGTGGNLRALTRLTARIHHHPNRPFLTIDELENLTDILFSLSYPKRQKQLGLKRNRADVIRPASAIALEMMRSFNFSKITVPNVGIKNGLFWQLADEIRAY